MDTTKARTKQRVETLFDALITTKINSPNNFHQVFNLLTQIYSQMFYDMKDKKHESGDTLHSYHDMIHVKLTDELNKNKKNIPSSQFVSYSEIWERELLMFYRQEYKDVDITFDMSS